MWLALGLLAAFLLMAIRPRNVRRGAPVNYWINIFLPVLAVFSGAFLQNGLLPSASRWGVLPSAILLSALLLGAVLLALGGIIHTRQGRR